MRSRLGALVRCRQPKTVIVDTWEAFDDSLTFNLGGDIASFGTDAGVRDSMTLESRIDWALEEVKEAMLGSSAAEPASTAPLRWILKASTLNKGAGVHLIDSFDQLRSTVHEHTDIREWVSDLVGCYQHVVLQIC